MPLAPSSTSAVAAHTRRPGAFQFFFGPRLSAERFLLSRMLKHCLFYCHARDSANYARNQRRPPRGIIPSFLRRNKAGRAGSRQTIAPPTRSAEAGADRLDRTNLGRGSLADGPPMSRAVVTAEALISGRLESVSEAPRHLVAARYRARPLPTEFSRSRPPALSARPSRREQARRRRSREQNRCQAAAFRYRSAAAGPRLSPSAPAAIPLIVPARDPNRVC